MSTVYWRVRRVLTLVALATAAFALPATAAFSEEAPITDPANFTVADIELEGLERVSAGAVYNYLPVNIGDTLNIQRVREAIRALYATGFFRDVQLRRNGNTLIVSLLERPSIESFEITGNKDIKTEDLQKSLRNVGLANGKTFDRSVLEDVTQYLTDQYYSRGKYAVRISAKVEEKSGNRVRIKIEIKEGKRAKIRQIAVVGNRSFSNTELQEGFELKTPNWTSWYKQDDRYSRESLQGDLERLRSFYMDRGYANFRIESQQVAIGPELNDIFITVNIDEGKIFKLSQVKLAGNFVVPKSELERLLRVAPGQVYSRKLITATQELLQNRLGQDGYAFAKAEAVPTTNEATNEISLTFFIDPANRVYVRNITFSGSNRINDEVLRREMRQLEGGWLSNVAVERSKQRLQRLPYVKNAEVQVTPVPGSPDQVDLNWKVEERPASELSGGIGYSQSQGFLLNGSIADSNVLGTGERAAISVNTGTYSKVYSISHTNPYYTVDGVSRTLNLSYADVSRLTSTYSTFSTKTYLAGLDFGYPITEYQAVHFGSSFQHAELATATTSSTQLQDWVHSNGNSFFRAVGTSYIPGTIMDTVELAGGWSYDSRNRTIFPTQGMAHRILLTSTIPGDAVEYMLATYQYEQYFHIPYVPLLNLIPFSLDTHLSYGTALGNTTALPPNRNFFTGGPDSVRGFREGTLGPRDSLGNAYGGDTALSGQLEAALPLPPKFSDTARVSLFFDFGESFYLGKTAFKDKAGFAMNYGFDLKQLRTSTGVSVQWLAPLGLFRFSLALPINYQRDNWKNYGDQTEVFQFSIGHAF
jgi:outer membrane protein insertion porin family